MHRAGGVYHLIYSISVAPVRPACQATGQHEPAPVLDGRTKGPGADIQMLVKGRRDHGYGEAVFYNGVRKREKKYKIGYDL